ncbi:glycoside hydrolase family 70 protein [Mariniluteicoccus flavus]
MAAGTLCVGSALPATATPSPQDTATTTRTATSRAATPASPRAEWGHDYDKRVIFQSFSVYQPYDKNMYATLGANSGQLAQWGVTDVWMPPAYRAFDMSRYMEGYAIKDRYDLGEFDQGFGGEKATKYGTAEELKALIAKLHGQGSRVQMDLVPNQMIGLNGREAVVSSRVDRDGRTRFVDDFTDKHTTTWVDELMLMYTKGGGPGQQKYGQIKEWNKNHFNGTSTQNIGRGDLLRDPSGKPFKVVGDNLNLPDWAWNGTPFSTSRGFNHVDGYLSARDAYEATPGNWRPYLINYPAFLDHAVATCGFADREAVKTGSSATMSVWDCKDKYIAATPAYGGRSEDRWYGNAPEGIEWDDQVKFQGHDTMGSVVNFEFLVGNDIDNSREDVVAEQKNWMKFLLDTYGFDGFRVDAASHVNPKVLAAESQVVSEKFGGDRSKYTSYLESYNTNEIAPVIDANNNTQLIMDAPQRDVANEAMMPNSGRRLADAYDISAAGSRIANPDGASRPNWSYVANHDKQTIQVNWEMLRRLGIQPGAQYGSLANARSFADEYTKAGEKAALDAWFADLSAKDKRVTDWNVPARYAMLLTNAKTVPTVWYGDLYRTDAAYMSTKTPYFDEIDALLKARARYVDGPQQVHQFATNRAAVGQDLVASVRDSYDRAKGIATVVSDDPGVDTWIKVPMGARHANQAYRDVTGKNAGTVITDGQGNLDLHVTGRHDADVRGHLGVWAPVDTNVQTAVHGAIGAKWAADQAILGQPKSGENCFLRDGGCFQTFAGGTIYWSPATGAHWVRGETWNKWASQGWENGFLGYPTTDEFCGLKDGGCGQHFQGGTIYWSPATGAHWVRGAIQDRFRDLGWELSYLGYPTTDEICGIRDGGCYNHFQGGSIYWSMSSGAHAIRGAIRDRWAALGWENSELGYPTTDETCGLRDGGCFNHFQRHSIYWSPASGVWEVKGAIRDFWARQGWERSRYAYPVGPEQCGPVGPDWQCTQRYQGGVITYNSARGVY